LCPLLTHGGGGVGGGGGGGGGVGGGGGGPIPCYVISGNVRRILKELITIFLFESAFAEQSTFF
jgi:hypothetical protein